MKDRAHDPLGHWVTPKAERDFTALNDELLHEAAAALCDQGWPAPPDETDVDTHFGTTHVFHYDGTGVPIVLLHGAGTSSLMWFPLLGGLVGRSVYAIDTVGDPGLSVQRLPINDRADLTAWLEEVLAALAVDRAYLVGASYGGWIALNYTLERPRRVDALLLIEPVLDKLRPRFWVHGIAVALAFATPRPIARRALRRLHMNTDLLEDRRVRRHGYLGLARYRRGLPRFAPVADAELAAISVPTLLLLGAHSEIHDSKRLLARARSTVPRLEAELVAGAGHGLPVDHAEAVASRVNSFLRGLTEGP